MPLYTQSRLNIQSGSLSINRLPDNLFNGYPIYITLLYITRHGTSYTTREICLTVLHNTVLITLKPVTETKWMLVLIS